MIFSQLADVNSGSSTPTPTTSRFLSQASQIADPAVDLKVQWDIQDWISEHVSHSTSVENTRININTTGKYSFSGAILMNGTNSNYRYTFEITFLITNLTKDDVRFQGGYIRSATGANENQIAYYSIIDLQEGDYIEVVINKIGGASGNSATIVNGTSLLVEYKHV